MNEQFLSYLWKNRLFSVDLKTAAGESLSILHPGDQNCDSGPDFFNARVRIGNTMWAGNVEIHVRASDWYRHGHQDDHAYDNTILHVVFEPDLPVNNQYGAPIPTLVLKNQYPESVFGQYQLMMLNQLWVPCYNHLTDFTDHQFSLGAPALAVERLVYKSSGIKKLWESCGRDWEEALYRHFGSGFGFRINGLPFELLAKSVPLKIVRQHCDKPFQTEALLFGQAGLLKEQYADDYPKSLLHEYHFLSGKYHLVPLNGSCWKFMRLRPTNFPTLRISQFAGFLVKSQARLFRMLESGTFSEVVDLLNISSSEYWNTHYVFDKPSPFREKIMGQASLNLLMINGLVPFLFFLGLEKDEPSLREKALNFLENLPGEYNSEISNWATLGLPCRNAMQTQALLHLKRFYCDKKHCLECRIGSVLLAKGREEPPEKLTNSKPGI